jgi:hypothetical protein
VGSLTKRLDKLRRNQIIEAIRAANLDPHEFDVEDYEVGVRIKHKLSDSHFYIGGDLPPYVGRHVVGDGLAMPYPEFHSWQKLMPRVSSWLQSVKLDLDTPDLWAELQREAELLGAGTDEVTENTPFTPDEQKEIARRLQELAEHARRTYSLSEAQMRDLNAKLDYLVNAAGRLGRIDWRNVFAGVFFGYILAAAVPPDAARDMFLGLLRGAGLFGLPELPLLC